MRRRLTNILLVLTLCFVAIPRTANAGWFSGNDELQKALAAPQITVGDQELDRDDLNTFYTARNFKPAWNFSGEGNAEIFTAFVKSIETLIDYHGLIREDYAVDLMRKLDASTDESDKIKLELLVTDTLLRLAHDLHGDYNNLSELYVGWNFDRTALDIPNTLQTAIATNNLNAYIENLSPKYQAYTQLAQALKKYREIAANGGWNPIASGGKIMPHDKGPRIAQMRDRLAAEGYVVTLPANGSPEFYDDGLLEQVKAYQTHNGLTADGHVGAMTILAMNTPVQDRIDQIMANMERWRHMPDDFPPTHFAYVNIPNASLEIFQDSKKIYDGIVIIGRVDRKTPFINSAIRSMIINPIWHVPTKIARKDILPKLRKDPHYLEKLGFTIKGNEHDPYGQNIDWKSMHEREFNFRLRQSAGDQNSLGRLKFDFDNDFAVYMHGTPHQELFKKDERTLSSGCVRLHDPEEVAEIYLAHNKEPWDKQKLDDEINSGKTRWVAIAEPVPLFVLYWTVFADENGTLQFRKDVYDYDRILMHSMRGEDDAFLKPPQTNSH